MLKRTKGRLLLTLLVITGLAGTLTNNSLNKQERKFATNYFKDTKSQLLNSVKGLSDQQLNFKSAPDRWSVKECFYHITMAEKGLWEMFEAGMKSPATPEKRAEIKVTDDEIIKMITDRSKKATAPEQMQPGKATWKTIDEVAAAFKTMRNDHIKYIKTTTEDLRNHIFQLPFGSIDGYQFLLFLAAHSNRHTQQLIEVKNDPNFPK